MLASVTYGPLPGEWPEDFAPDFERIRATGFDALRLYDLPTPDLLDAAREAGLLVFAGLRWPSATDFVHRSAAFAQARVALVAGLRRWGSHPALAGVFVANEVPADIARWIGPARVREALEELIRLGRAERPDRLFAYGNFPTTEFLEPGNADFTAMNVYLEDEASFRKYLRRLHHIAGDRPVMISEFGLDSQRNGVKRQAEVLRWALRAAREAAVAGFTVFAWTDRWQNAGAEVTDWDFGITDRAGKDKPALTAVADELRAPDSAPLPGEPAADAPPISVIVCTRNGRRRVVRCLKAIRELDHPAFETILVDDGSVDHTASLVERHFPEVRVLRLPHSGLSAARNAGAAAARGAILAFTDDDCRPDREWLKHLEAEFENESWDAIGGPNLPPPPESSAEAVVAAAPGAPSHVMLDDEEAEHVPGCNLAVRRSAFDQIDGFDPQFHTAGDDVDFCWRLRQDKLRIGFSPAAFVWHDRRPDALGYLRQQWGYGRAEAMLNDKFPQRFSRRGGARWLGHIYEGGAIRAGNDAVIYHGPLGNAGYQAVVDRMLPRRPVDDRFHSALSRFWLAALERWQPLLRGAARRCFRRARPQVAEIRKRSRKQAPPPEAVEEQEFWSAAGRGREQLLKALLGAGWQTAGDRSGWDLERDGCRLLAATELADGPGRLTRVRVSGATKPVAAAMPEISRLAGVLDGESELKSPAKGG